MAAFSSRGSPFRRVPTKSGRLFADAPEGSGKKGPGFGEEELGQGSTVEVMKQRQHLVKADFEIALDLCTQLDDLWERGGFDSRRLLCETLFKKIHVEGGNINQVLFNAPFSFIASQKGGSGTIPFGGANRLFCNTGKTLII
jgi:hypothetical protein